MKKLLTIAVAVASIGVTAFGDNRPPVVIPIYNNNEPVNTVSQPTANVNTFSEWQSLFRPIAQCVSELQKEPTAKSPEDKTKYLARHGYGTGYYVLIDTKRYTLDDICYLKYTMTKYGYSPTYIEPIDTMVGGIFRRKADAEALADWLKKDQGIKAKIEYIESDMPFVPPSNPKSPPPYESESTQSSNSDLNHFEKLQAKYDKAMYKRLLDDEKLITQLQQSIQTLEQEIAQLEKQTQQQPQTLYCTASQGLIFREKPSWRARYQEFEFLGGEHLKVLGTDGDFYKVQYKNMTGYVAKEYCHLHGSY
jgi:hypothetical protein